MAAAAILDFWNREILLVTRVQRVETHQHANFCQNRSIGGKDINIFRFLKMGTAAILDFLNREFLFAASIWMAQMHHCTNFVKIGLSVAKILRLFDFSRWRSSAILDLFEAYLDYPQWVLGGLYHSTKFGYDRCNSFYNMNISTFGTFGWKMLIHAHKIGFFGQFDPLNGLQ